MSSEGVISSIINEGNLPGRAVYTRSVLVAIATISWRIDQKQISGTAMESSRVLLGLLGRYRDSCAEVLGWFWGSSEYAEKWRTSHWWWAQLLFEYGINMQGYAYPNPNLCSKPCNIVSITKNYVSFTSFVYEETNQERVPSNGATYFSVSSFDYDVRWKFIRFSSCWSIFKIRSVRHELCTKFYSIDVFFMLWK